MLFLFLPQQRFAAKFDDALVAGADALKSLQAGAERYKLGECGQIGVRPLRIAQCADEALLDRRQKLPVVQHQHLVEQQHRQVSLLIDHRQIAVNGKFSLRRPHFQRNRRLVQISQTFHEIESLVVDRLGQVGFDSAIDFRKFRRQQGQGFPDLQTPEGRILDRREMGAQVSKEHPDLLRVFVKFGAGIQFLDDAFKRAPLLLHRLDFGLMFLPCLGGNDAEGAIHQIGALARDLDRIDDVGHVDVRHSGLVVERDLQCEIGHQTCRGDQHHAAEQDQRQAGGDRSQKTALLRIRSVVRRNFRHL